MNLLVTEDLSKRFGGVHALNDCSLEVEEGSITGLIGPNGAGKTTLFNVISGHLRPDHGQVRLGGQEVQRFPSHRVARMGLTRTFQMTRELQRLTVRENLLLAARDQVGLNLYEALVKWGQVQTSERDNMRRADELIDFFSLGELRDAPAGSLSGGQRKLLDLARALMTEPRILLLDEPTAGVNPALVDIIADRIKELNREQALTFFVVEHNMGFVERVSDSVVVMAEGQVLLEGPFDEVRRHPDVLEAYLGRGLREAPSGQASAAGSVKPFSPQKEGVEKHVST